MKTTNTNRKQATKASKQTKPAPAVIADTATDYKQLPPAPIDTTRPRDIITADSVQTMAEIIAVTALKTNYAKSGMPFIYSLYCGLIADITENKKTGAPLSDGYDIVQEATAFLCEHIGKATTDTTTDGQTDKNGNPIDIWRACFRVVNRYILREKRREFKRVYVDDIDADGNTLYYEIPAEWDTPTATDYKHITAVIKALNLTSRQAQILRYRLSGKSLHQIADILKIHRKTLQEHMQALQRKYTEYTKAQTANA